MGGSNAAGQRVAEVAEQWLAAGAMASTLRVADYVRFLDAFAGHGKLIKDTATSCGMFAGACLIHAGVLPSRPPPAARAITTWVGAGGFGSKSWVPADESEPMRGDVLYICSTRGSLSFGGKTYTWTRWEDALNGHVIVVRGDGWIAPTAEGGGSPGGTGCRLSAAPKDLRALGRPPRGMWRPSLMGAQAVPSSLPAPPLVQRTLRKGMSGEDVRALQRALGKIAVDGSFGAQTDARVREFQQVHGLVADGVVGPKTWAAFEKAHAT